MPAAFVQSAAVATHPPPTPQPTPSPGDDVTGASRDVTAANADWPIKAPRPGTATQRRPAKSATVGVRRERIVLLAIRRNADASPVVVVVVGGPRGRFDGAVESRKGEPAECGADHRRRSFLSFVFFSLSFPSAAQSAAAAQKNSSRLSTAAATAGSSRVARLLWSPPPPPPPPPPPRPKRGNKNASRKPRPSRRTRGNVAKRRRRRGSFSFLIGWASFQSGVASFFLPTHADPILGRSLALGGGGGDVDDDDAVPAAAAAAAAAAVAPSKKATRRR